VGLDEARHLRFLGRRPADTNTLDYDFLQRKLTNKLQKQKPPRWRSFLDSLLALTPQSPKETAPAWGEAETVSRDYAGGRPSIKRMWV
jgi:hypothetical protein